jgi:hypothetical protein
MFLLIYSNGKLTAGIQNLSIFWQEEYFWQEKLEYFWQEKLLSICLWHMLALVLEWFSFSCSTSTWEGIRVHQNLLSHLFLVRWQYAT